MKKLAIGVDDFKLLREQDSYFVDKSLFIEQLIEDGSQVLLFPRPRRFGKTLNMSMLQYFFNHRKAEENRKLFKGLAIEKSPVFEKHQGQYPLISLSFKSCKGDSFEKVLAGMKNVLATSFKHHKYEIENTLTSKDEKEEFSLLEQKDADESLLAQSLLLLTHLLFKKYNKKVIILLDEYDTPVHEGYLHGFYDKVVNLLRIMLGNALKGNDCLQKGVLTGILRVSKESMFSDLNNVMVYSLLKEQYNTAFGFTQNEVDELLEHYELSGQTEMVKLWYNGYYFGNEEIYNPWSILNFATHKGRFEAYWLGTSSNDLVHKLIKDSDNSVKKDIEDALNGIPIMSRIDENISFQYLEKSRENILSFFVQTGYLKAKFHAFENNNIIHQIEIPNIELGKIYHKVIKLWFEQSIGSTELNQMLKALLLADIPTFERIFSKFVLETLSYFNVGRKTKEVERVFQAFLLGMLIGLKDTYEVYSEKESGYGRFDVSLIPKDKSQQAVIMELKSIDTFNNESKDDTLNASLKQIQDRQYETSLRQQGCHKIMKIAVTFDGKRVWAKVG